VQKRVEKRQNIAKLQVGMSEWQANHHGCIIILLLEEKNRYRFVIQPLVILVRSCIGFIWASAGPLLPLIMKEYGINRGTAGWFASSAPLAIAICAIPVGIVLSRFSLKKTFVVGAFLQAGGIFTPLCSTYYTLLLTRICFAIGTAITVPVAIAIAAEWFTARELPVVNGLTLSCVSLGNAIAFLVTVPLATVLSWKAPPVIYAALALTGATAWLILGRDRRKAKTTTDSSPPSLPEKAELSTRQVITQRSTILLTMAVTGTWCLGNAMGSWLPSYYHEVFHMSLEKSSAIFALSTGVGIMANIFGGILSLRIGRRKPFLIIPGIFLGLSAMGAVLFNNPVVIYVSIAFFGLFSNIQSPVLFTIPMEIPNIPPRKGSIIVSVMQSGGNFGNFIAPLIVGYLADITGSYLPGFIICAVLSLGLLVAGLMMPETGPKFRKYNPSN
jgi:MFS family permease